MNPERLYKFLLEINAKELKIIEKSKRSTSLITPRKGGK